MKKTATPKAPKPVKSPALLQDLPARLTELEAEIRLYPSRPEAEWALKSLEKASKVTVGKDEAIQFHLDKKIYAAGHTDVTYRDSNHARGVRHIRFYEDGKVVLDIEGDYEDQQFGSNFRFQNIDLYVPGPWEAELVKLTDEFRRYKIKRSLAFKKKRAAEYGRARTH
jgi:hypothetical protein